MTVPVISPNQHVYQEQTVWFQCAFTFETTGSVINRHNIRDIAVYKTGVYETRPSHRDAYDVWCTLMF